jgi:hypothetical protein
MRDTHLYWKILAVVLFIFIVGISAGIGIGVDIARTKSQTFFEDGKECNRFYYQGWINCRITDKSVEFVFEDMK